MMKKVVSGRKQIRMVSLFNMNLFDKKVLLFAPKFFGYEKEIKNELENLGAKVIYFDERPKNDFFTKVFIRLNLKFFISKQIGNYYKNILESIKKENIDYLFLIAPETIDLKTIEEIKQNNKDIKILTYFWDSIKNRKKALTYLDISNKFFSFDSNDVKINNKIEFLPLFYIKDYENISNTKQDILYDICFIGTVHSDRYRIIKQIENQIINKGLKTYFYFYSPNKVLFFFQKLIKKDFKDIKWEDVSFNSLNKSNVIEVIEKSSAIVDIQHPLQTGLTMRTIEMLGANKKILTTNSNIANYDFYHIDNIFIFDRNKVQINNEFFNKKYFKLDNDIYKRYSLNNWLKIIFKE